MTIELDSKPLFRSKVFRQRACSCASPVVAAVIDSRPFAGHDLAMRSRSVRCAHCGGRFRTIELVATPDLLAWLNDQPGYVDGDGI